MNKCSMYSVIIIYKLAGDSMVEHILRASIERNCVITIIYQKGNIITKRNIKVLEIADSHVKAFCYMRKQRRIFKMENILSAAYLKSSRMDCSVSLKPVPQ